MAAATLPVRSCLVDGEAIVDDDNGIVIFDRSAVTVQKREDSDEPLLANGRYTPKATDCCAAAKCREWDGPAALPPPTAFRVCGGLVGRRSTTMPRTTTIHAVTTIGIDMGKNTLHMVGLDLRGAIVLREKVSRGRITSRLANLPSCLIGIEAGMATHYVARELAALGHDVKQVPPAYAKPFRQEQKNGFRDAHAVAEAVQRPTTRFVPAKTDEQLDLQALHRVRSRLVSERTAVINQIRGFLLERGIIVRQGLRFLRQALPDILAKRTDVLSPRMVRIIADLASDWRQLDGELNR